MTAVHKNTQYSSILANQATAFISNFYFALLFITLLLPIRVFAAEPASIPSISTISRLAIAAVEEKIEAPDKAKIQITPQSLDTRVNLPNCYPPITAEIASDRAIRRNNTVKVSCKSPDLSYPWQIFLSVRADILYPVVVAKSTMGPGDLLSNSDIEIEYIDQTSLRGHQFEETQQVVGARLKRRVIPGQPIFANQLCIICKGDSVSIYARSKNFQIKTVGEALQDGNVGDKIRIKNSHSHKNLDARVTGVGQVEVRM
ncbi:flagella basal body P-ring formation protein FlgA [Shewanella sairae]|uniref:Flagella basal body P-ring formation protein FlgA n=1 Tax=Shewanella sairae TaxID=190310 RepID=A0ABQ4PP13_9GAMM|nr:flagellar basal body P-ring formation chaperone FlgA [Shewanella sairae]MCL1129255.1 flagellar basal body P-ring formation protein FlgA [Shewanella sairae]GIU50262.1 flagella basal body P-ring formation protein FlgA [Shewanella sairae]